MTPRTRSLIFTLLTLLVLGVSLTRPLSARADEGTPTEAPAPAQDTSASSGESATAMDLPVADAPTAEPSDAPLPTQDVSAPATEAPIPADPAATDAPTDTPAAEPTSLPDVLDQAPPATDIMVLNQAGHAEPLATQAAADIIQNGDPLWCPQGVTVANSTDCVNAGTVANLITLLSTKSGAGVVYFTSTYSTPDATFDGTDSNLASLTGLTLQGGWDGVASGTIAYSGGSVFSVPISVINWANDVALNDITVDGASGIGLTISTTGNIKLHNVTSQNNGSDGAYLDNSGGSDSMALTGTNLNSNGSFGLEAFSNGNISLDNVTADGNASAGVALENNYSGSSAEITLTGTNEFNDNGSYGLFASSHGNIGLSNATANDNGYDGARLDNTGGSGFITLTGTNEFNGNAGSGLKALANRSISLNNVTADQNYSDGAYLDNTGGSGSITLAGTNVLNDNERGLIAISNGNISLNNLTADGNTSPGAVIENNWNSSNAVITLTGTNAFNDNELGLIVYSNGNITLSNVTANDNDYAGLNLLTLHGATVECSAFENNGGFGVDADASTLNLNGDTFVSNASGDYTNTGMVTVSTDCKPSLASGGGAGGQDPNAGASGGYRVIPVTGSGLANLDCSGVLGVTLQLADGDRVILYCPVSGQGSASTMPAAQLPAPVSQGTLVSALTFNVVGEGGLSEQTLGSGAAVSFALPEGGLDNDYAILYWDTTAADGTGAWVELQNGPLHDPSDDKFVTDAGSKTADGSFETRVNFTGTFALVHK